MKTLKFERLISKLCLNDNITISGFIDKIENNDRFIEFLYRMPNDNNVYSCQLDINLNDHKVGDVLDYITNKFYPEFHEMLGYESMTYDEYINSLYSSNDDEEDEEYESEASVAKGAGFLIDDDGNWVPDDDMDDVYHSYEYPILYDEEDENDESVIIYSKEYIYFVITYQEKNCKINYKNGGSTI